MDQSDQNQTCNYYFEHLVVSRALSEEKIVVRRTRRTDRKIDESTACLKKRATNCIGIMIIRSDHGLRNRGDDETGNGSQTRLRVLGLDVHVRRGALEKIPAEMES